ncbi:glutathione S-transferase family protein [Pseudonocardia sp. TMWB2A]|uniref:glutathione S-transferase family protein n=1 Tax=Pseudonocardia sp. TMWB2A TaxID=687430 RepID=UPI00307F0844
MPINPQAPLEITAFNWVPDFAQGFVRDLRPRWACEEIGLDYNERLISAVKRAASHFADQPWGQVPTAKDGDIHLFESGAILLHIAEKDERLLPRDPQGRATVLSWLFAAFNSIEPSFFELGNIDVFSKEEQWAELRRPGLVGFLGKRLDRLDEALGDKPWLAGDFSVADIAMVTILREGKEDAVIKDRPRLAAYVERGMARPAFERALSAQLAVFAAHPPKAA